MLPSINTCKHKGLRIHIAHNERETYYIDIEDKVHKIHLRSLVGPQTQDNYNSIFSPNRDWEQEAHQILNIRNQDAQKTGYASGAQSEVSKYFGRLQFEAERFQVTPFSSFSIFKEDDQCHGRVGIAQGYDPSDVVIKKLQSCAHQYGITPNKVYVSGANEVQIGVTTDEKALYPRIKQMAFLAAEFFQKTGYQKPPNSCDRKTYFTSHTASVDKLTVTNIAPDRLDDQDPRKASVQIKQKALKSIGLQMEGYLLPKHKYSGLFDSIRKNKIVALAMLGAISFVMNSIKSFSSTWGYLPVYIAGASYFIKRNPSFKTDTNLLLDGITSSAISGSLAMGFTETVINIDEIGKHCIGLAVAANILNYAVRQVILDGRNYSDDMREVYVAPNNRPIHQAHGIA